MLRFLLPRRGWRAIATFPTNAYLYPLSFLKMDGVGPFSVLVFAAVIAYQMRAHPDSLVIDDISKVSGLYGKGSYYGWLVNAIVLVYESRFSNGTAVLSATLAVAILPLIAAGSQLQCVFRPASCVQPQRDASDRVVMADCIVNMHYILQRIANARRPRADPGLPPVPEAATPSWMPSSHTVIRILFVLLDTIAMAAYDVHRGTLNRRLLLAVGPFLICIAFPLIIIYYFEQERWATTVINTGAIVESVIYAYTPDEHRYDPASPTAPISNSSLKDLDQVAAMVIGLLTLAPHIINRLKHLRRGWAWALRLFQNGYSRLVHIVRGQVRRDQHQGLIDLAVDTEYHRPNFGQAAHLLGDDGNGVELYELAG
ncbi:hypothetical protein IQ06DRAFT_359350 [Phaeosphaeriaceae sp. SRC1lsM3a]|nr:hypothetical protein IQ06DRAFT_359350 [Stagonospora sp. SRC1lsM3a]